MSCTSAQKRIISDETSFNNWSNIKRNVLNTLSVNKTGDVDSILTDLTTMDECIQYTVDSRASIHNTINHSQDTVSDLNNKIAQEETNAAIARDRVSYIRHPEQNVSNYESWFPIDRPIKTFSLVIIISITIFMGTLIFLMVLSNALGINVVLSFSNNFQSDSSWFFDQFTDLTVISILALLFVLIYFTTKYGG